MIYKTVTLRGSAAMPRDVHLSRTSSVYMASLQLSGQSMQIAFAAAESAKCRLQRSRSLTILWIGDASFDLLEHEAEAASKLFELPFPPPLTAAPERPSLPRSRAAVGGLLDVRA